MLSTEALNSAMPLTEVLDNNRLALVPVPGTTLEALVKATRSDVNFNEVTAGGYNPQVTEIAFIANAKDTTFGQSPHDLVMDDIVEVAVKAVQGHIVFAKTVVAPTIAELVEKTMTAINNLTPSTLLGMNVITWMPPKPLDSSAFETSVRRFEEVPFDSPKMDMQLPLITVVEMMELMETGTSGLDKDIAEWAASKGDTFFINIWENVFQIKQAPLNERIPVTFKSFIEDRECGIDNALAIYLLARHLTDNPMTGTEMSLPRFQTTIVAYRNQAGARLCRALDDLTTYAKNGVLIRTAYDGTTVVNGNLYRKWIEEGGENEVLFGNLLDLPFVTTIEQINAKAAKLKGVWERHSALTATLENNRRFSRTKEILNKCFQAQMRDIPEGEETTAGVREMAIKKFSEKLDDVREDELRDLYSLALKLVCHSRFCHTDAERILSGIERVKKENPSVPVREAAAVSVIEYIGYWLSTQMKVISV